MTSLRESFMVGNLITSFVVLAAEYIVNRGIDYLGSIFFRTSPVFFFPIFSSSLLFLSFS